MLTKEENDFIRYWGEQRLRKKQFLRKFSIGLPLAVLVAGGLLVNLLSGWYEKATMELNKEKSLIIVILVAVAGIVVFITIFSSYHRWDRNEAAYQDLLRKKQREAAAGEKEQSS